ncbi:MAG: helix-turn-helix domain-containing protein [Treponema sp.]|jgi:AraC-like DNA-binding protein/ligand-binding sensor protein|nr:helix-turn-helix domain-containing protein [Treponema sp.]
MLKAQNIIQRRDLDPLWFRANEVVRHYAKAANCIASVMGADCVSVDYSINPKALFFCSLCKRYNPYSRDMASNEHPCTNMHRDAIKEARRFGGSYVYTCPIGFIFWTSPFYSGERFAGALMSSGFLAVEHQLAVERIFKVCKGEVPREEIERSLRDIPKKTSDEVKALAQMLLICTKQISESRFLSMADSAESVVSPESAGRQPCDYAYFLDRERLLVASLRRADHDEAQKILRELLNALYTLSCGNFEYFRIRAIELVVLLSRSAADAGNTGDTSILETNNRYLKKIEDAQTVEEVSEFLNIIINRMAGNIFSFQGIRHASALRKAERFIWKNYTRKVSLQEIAQVSGLSAPYFSTIFKEEMGENLSSYLNRLRVEKASAMLRETEQSISKIATASGFEDQSWFSKIFKNYTGFSPGKYREHGGILP